MVFILSFLVLTFHHNAEEVIDGILCSLILAILTILVFYYLIFTYMLNVVTFTKVAKRIQLLKLMQ